MTVIIAQLAAKRVRFNKYFTLLMNTTSKLRATVQFLDAQIAAANTSGPSTTILEPKESHIQDGLPPIGTLTENF